MSKSKFMVGNIRPTDMAAVLAPDKRCKIAVFPMIRGFTHEAASRPIINCRIESADIKPLWKDSWFKRRCVIPASWYYEWGVPPSEGDLYHRNEYYKIKRKSM